MLRLSLRLCHFQSPLGSAKQNLKAFLLEMPVVRENAGQSFIAHGLHRNAIRETVSLVEPGRAQIEASFEGRAALRKNANFRIAF